MNRTLRVVCSLAVGSAMGLLAAMAVAQSKPTQPMAKQVQAAVSPATQDVAETQEQFLKLLRTSSTLTTVLAHDPSLLSDQAYVTRNNPELERFLTAHPEVAQNPDFYLFGKVGPGRRDQALARAVWPDMIPPQQENRSHDFWEHLPPMVISIAFFFVIGWLAKLFVESRRWSRTFKLQSEIHARLIDKFGSSQELIAYMGTDAGKRFLEAAPIPMGTEMGGRTSNALARILTPLQAGIVLAMLGAGMLLVRHAGHDSDVPMLVLGTLVLMPGLGFILSSGVTWMLAGKLGLMLPAPATQAPVHEPLDTRNGE